MRDKIAKIKRVFNKDGFFNTLVKLWKYFYARYISKIDFISKLYYMLNKRKYEAIVDEILKTSYDRVVIWRSDFGWNVPLFQRPQHISSNLANNNCLVLYEVTIMTDKVKTISKVKDNLYLVNFSNSVIKNIVLSKLKATNTNKYIEFYSTDFRLSLSEVLKYVSDGFKVIYEYIDDLSAEIVGTKEIPKNMKDKYEYMLKDTKNVFAVVSADALKQDVETKRGTEKLAVSSNGVDYNHFKQIDNNYQLDEDFEKVIKTNKPIIGYYGAIASWFDYELIKYVAKQRPNYNIVLIGVKYDDSLDSAGIEEYENIYHISAKDYSVLQNYANKFTVCTIPFVINSITNATSPVKLFEYMALDKPIVTTAMPECKKYKSVMIANNYEEFLSLIDRAIKINKQDNKEYYDTLEKEALENTWDEKAKAIVNLLKKYE